MRTLVIVLVAWLFLGGGPVSAQSGAATLNAEQITALNRQVVQAYQQGRYAEAIELARQSLAASERLHGPDHSQTATSLNNLAGLFESMGRYDEALPLYRRALQIKEKELGPDPASTATSLNNLAYLLSGMGRYDEALPLYRRALQIREQALGPDDPDTAGSLNNLAGLFRAMGRYDEALPLYRRALQIHEKVLGSDHASTATSLNNLAGLVESMGRYDEALPLYRRALQIHEKVLGSDHASTATSLNNLAGLFESMGRYDEALPLYRRALQIREQALGTGHPDTAGSLNNLASLFESMGRYDEALPLYRRALEIQENAFGPDSLYVATILNNIAKLLFSANNYNEAVLIIDRVLEISEKSLNHMNIRAIQFTENAAILFRVVGRNIDALTMYNRIYHGYKKIYPHNHHKVVSSLIGMADIYGILGKNTEALDIYFGVVKTMEAISDSDKSFIANVYHKIAHIYMTEKSYHDAEYIYNKSLDMRLGVNSEFDNLYSAITINEMAEACIRQNKIRVAENMYKKALHMVLGTNNKQRRDVVGVTKIFLMSKHGFDSFVNESVFRYNDIMPIDFYLAKFSFDVSRFLYELNPTKNLNNSIFYMKISINSRQNIRMKIINFDKNLESNFIDKTADAYEFLVKLLIQEDRLAEAEKVSFMLKESNLVDYLRRNGSSPAAAGEMLRWTDEEESLHQALQNIAREWVAYHAQWAEADKARKAGRIRDDGPEFAALDQRRQQLETQSDNLLKQASENFQAKSRAAAEKSLASFTTARTALAQKLSDIAQLDGQPSPRTAGLLLLPDERGLTMVVTTERGATALMVPVDATTLGTLVLNLRTALDGRGDYRQAAKALHAHLIAPAEQALGPQAAEIRQWAVLPYGVLRNLPFGVLMDDSDRHLIERYALVALTADGTGGLDSLDATPKSQWRSAALGASIADSEFKNVALPGVRGELCGIVNDPNSAADCTKATPLGVLNGRRYLNGQFTADQLNRLLGTPVGTSAPTLLHIATHFSIDKSLLLLGDGDKLKLSQLVNWNPRLGHYDLIALSACDSGKSTEGVESLGGLLRRQGAKSVLATLWPIADVGAGPLMVEFYRQRGAQRAMAKSEALRRAQLAMLRGELKNPDNPAIDLRHPYFWAGYVLMGNWL